MAKKPIIGIAGCCARAATGQVAAAPPRSCEGNNKIAIVPSGRAPRHDQTASRRVREGRNSAFDLTSFAQVDRVYLHPEQWRHGLDDGKIAGSRPLAGIPEDRHLRDPRRNFFE